MPPQQGCASKTGPLFSQTKAHGLWPCSYTAARSQVCCFNALHPAINIYMDYYSFTNLRGMEGWVSIVGWPTTDSYWQWPLVNHIEIPEECSRSSADHDWRTERRRCGRVSTADARCSMSPLTGQLRRQPSPTKPVHMQPTTQSVTVITEAHRMIIRIEVHKAAHPFLRVPVPIVHKIRAPFLQEFKAINPQSIKLQK